MRSIELNWLWRKDKWVILPDIKFVSSDSDDGSYYLHPNRYLIDNIGNEHYSKHGLICIMPNSCGVAVDAVIAHEWEHHLQFHRGFDFSTADASVDMEWLNVDTEECYREYYSRPHEREALRAECIRTSDEYARWLWYITTGQTWKQTMK